MARGEAADTVNSCQLISLSHTEEYLQRNKNVNLKRNKNVKHLINYSFSQNITKYVSSLIHLTSYGSLYRYLQQISNKSNEYSYNYEKTAIFIATYFEKNHYSIAISTRY